MLNNAMGTDSAIRLRFESAITGVEPVMANRWATIMKTFIILLLSCVCAVGAETDIRIFSYAETNAENASIYRKDVFTRDGLTNLFRITRVDPQKGEVRIFRFYHAGQLVGNFVAFPEESVFNTEATPYCMSLKYGPAGQIRSARIGDKDGVLLDEFRYTDGIFSPVEGPLRWTGMKPRFGDESELLQRNHH